MTLSKQIIIGDLEKFTISQIDFHVTHSFANLWLFYVNSYRLVRAKSNGYGESVRMHKFVYILYFFFSHALTDMAHVPSAEFNYKGTNTNLPPLFENVHRVFEY